MQLETKLFNAIQIEDNKSLILLADVQAKATELEAEEQAKDTKASAKAKLMSGEALTEDEANTIVLQDTNGLYRNRVIQLTTTR